MSLLHVEVYNRFICVTVLFTISIAYTHMHHISVQMFNVNQEEGRLYPIDRSCLPSRNQTAMENPLFVDFFPMKAPFTKDFQLACSIAGGYTS